MRNLINKLITSLKKETFLIDSNIPLSYIFLFFLSMFRDLLWGIIRLHRLCFVHYTSSIKCKNKLQFGAGFRIDRSCYIDALSLYGIVCGNNVSIGKLTTIECTGSLKQIGKGLVVGNNVGLGNHCLYGCAGGITIGDNTIIGSFVSMHSENHIFNNLNIPIRQQGVSHKGITIGKNCWIGAKATILDGANIGDGCIIAAGAVVLGSISPNSVAGGIPAKVIKCRNNL